MKTARTSATTTGEDGLDRLLAIAVHQRFSCGGGTIDFCGAQAGCDRERAATVRALSVRRLGRQSLCVEVRNIIARRGHVKRYSLGSCGNCTVVHYREPPFCVFCKMYGKFLVRAGGNC